MTENKPCPFCGGTQLSADWDGSRWMHVTCNACDARSPSVRVLNCELDDAEKRAFVEWNRRAP